MNDDLPIPILVARLRAGDRTAAAVLAERAGTLALRTATAALGDPNQARVMPAPRTSVPRTCTRAGRNGYVFSSCNV